MAEGSKIVEVVDKATGDKIKIKSDRFNGELHEVPGSAPAKKKRK